MDNENHKNTWNNFTKFVLWGTVAVIIVLVLMSILILCYIKQLLFVNILKFVKFSQYYALNFV